MTIEMIAPGSRIRLNKDLPSVGLTEGMVGTVEGLVVSDETGGLEGITTKWDDDLSEMEDDVVIIDLDSIQKGLLSSISN